MSGSQTDMNALSAAEEGMRGGFGSIFALASLGMLIAILYFLVRIYEGKAGVVCEDESNNRTRLRRLAAMRRRNNN